MKSPSNRVVLKKDYQRLQEWRGGTCPYCGSGHDHIMAFETSSGKMEYTCCHCGNMNIFSGAILKRTI
jgi:DNA-directed RNA polymerase subunit RPC12/RpoP